MKKGKFNNQETIVALLSTTVRGAADKFRRFDKREKADQLSHLAAGDTSLNSGGADPNEQNPANIAASHDEEALKDQIQKALVKNGIPDNAANAFMLQNLEGMKGNEIADKLGISHGNVRFLLSKHKAKIIDVLKQELAGSVYDPRS